MRFVEEGVDVLSFLLFDPALCREWIALLDARDDWKRGFCRTHADLALSSMPRIQDAVGASVDSMVRPIATLQWSSRFALTDGWIFRYDVDDYAALHIDAAYARNPRVLSVVAYLNDDYEGGETVFPRQKTTIRPKAGTAVLFPSGITHPHRGGPITRGRKYVLVLLLDFERNGAPRGAPSRVPEARP